MRISIPTEHRSRDFSNEKMKICFLSDPNYVHTQRWARYFLKRGHEACIIGDPRCNPIELSDIKIHILDDRKFRGPWILRSTLALRRLLREIQPDILHMHYLGPLVSPLLLRFRPFVVSVWGSDVIGEQGLAQESRKIHFLKQIILRRADAVVALSKFLAKATCRYAGLPEQRILVQYWGIDRQQFRARKMGRTDLIVIGFVKHLLPKYGPEYLLRSIPIVRKAYPAIKVLLVGDGPLRSNLESLAKELEITDVVTFCGRLPHEKVPEYVAQMDVMVMPSIYESETFGVAAAEAEAIGVPVVATNVGGIPEAVADGVTGILVPPRDPQALASAVLRLIEEPALWETMSREGPKFIAANFDWETNAAKMEQLYRSLLVAKQNRDR